MNHSYHAVAVDIGGGGGKMVDISFDGRKMKEEKDYSFANNQVMLVNTFYWDVLSLYDSIKKGLVGFVQDTAINSMGIDTWGVDFGLVDVQGRLIQNVHHMRDRRTEGIPEEIFKVIPEQELYYATGCDCSRFYGLYQLYYLYKNTPWVLENAAHLLFTPDLLNYFFTGNKNAADITMAGSSQLLDSTMQNWAFDVFKKIGLPHHYLNAITKPAYVAGNLLPHVQEEIGDHDFKVISVAGHDSPSAFCSIPGKNKFYISGGTYLITGIETHKPVYDDKMVTYDLKNTNAGNGDNLVYRNTTGFWILKECIEVYGRRGKVFGYGDMMELAMREKPYQSFINVDDPRFSAKSADMVEEIQSFCKKTGQTVPETPGQIARCLFESYILKIIYCYDAVCEISKENEYNEIYIISGVSKNAMFAQMVSDALGLPVRAGLPNATIAGNAGVQLLCAGEIGSYDEIGDVIANSFELITYEPRKSDWRELYNKMKVVLQYKF